MIDFIYIKSMIARVGNSASFGFPHLHMHVSQGGYAGDVAPVPVLFEATFDFAHRARNHLYVR